MYTVAKSGYFQSFQNEILAYCPAARRLDRRREQTFLSKLSSYFWHRQLRSPRPPRWNRPCVRSSVRSAQLFTGRAVVSLVINVKEIPDTIAQTTPQTAPSSPLHNSCGKASFKTCSSMDRANHAGASRRSNDKCLKSQTRPLKRVV